MRSQPVKFAEYKQPNGETRTLVRAVGSGDILRRFDKTPAPLEATDVVCPHFMMLAWANGCQYNCAWCYLRGTFRFYGQKPNGRVPMKFKPREKIQKAVQAFLESDSAPEIINTGELCDSLMQETGENPFSVWLLKQFQGTPHRILFLTKSTNIQHFLKNEFQKNTVLAWSVNASKVAERWENYAPSVADRLLAAKAVADAGYEVRLRIDPMVPVKDWRDEYTNLVDSIFNLLTPERVTLGCLRGLATTLIYAKDKSWIPYLTEKSNWGKKPPFKQRLDMYHAMIEKLRENGLHKMGVCKDTLGLWRTLDLRLTEIKCNCVW